MGIVLPRLVSFPGAGGVARVRLLPAAEGVLLRLLLRLGPVLLTGLFVAGSARVRARVQWLGVFSTAPHRSCVPCDSPSAGGLRPTFMSLDF